jgi:hypothetical protein
MAAMARTWFAVGGAALCVGVFFALRGCGEDDEPSSDETRASSAALVTKTRPSALRRRADRRDDAPSQKPASTDATRDDRLAAAMELKRRILEQMALRTPLGANESLKLANELDRGFKEEAIRAAVGVRELETAVVEARDALFRVEVPRRVFAAMDRLIEKRVREAPADDTLAAVKRWAMRELPAAMWSETRTDLGIQADESEKFWKTRDVATPRQATYGTRSFIVSKDTRVPNGVGKPPTEEEWWAGADAAARAAWLTANFAETSGCFRVDDAKGAPCPDCSGDGFIGRRRCITCNGFGVVRTVVFR